ncbi:MAG: phosphotransferase [Pseudomonadota bacterium]
MPKKQEPQEQEPKIDREKDREVDRAAFLADAGWGAAQCGLLAADASFRSYYRVQGQDSSAVLMDAPPPKESVAAFHAVQETLLRLGFSAPKPVHLDRQKGFLLLEDLGDRTFTEALRAGGDEEALYRLAIDVLIDLHKNWDGGPASLAPYSDDLLRNEVLLLTDWYFEAVMARAPSNTERDDYIAAWDGLWPLTRHVPDSLVLRDYHVDNLMELTDRRGTERCGLLDFQDAVKGPITYDIVSLLEDARRDVSNSVISHSLTHYLEAFPDLDRADFETSYAVLGAQRSAKIIGIFTRLSRRDGKSTYLAHIPRVWRLLQRDLRHPALAKVQRWFDTALPNDKRQQPAHLSPHSLAKEAQHA